MNNLWSRGFSPVKYNKAKASPPGSGCMNNLWSRGFSPENKHRHLSHIDIKDHYQFITFRTQDSVDPYLRKLAGQNLPNSKQQLAIDKYLDQSQNGAYLTGEILLFLSEFLKLKDTVLYELIAFCIMPNHVHLLIKPLDNLAIIMRLLKGGSAKIINKMMQREGQFWEKDYYDKLVRDEKHFAVVHQYIKNNPALSGELRFYSIYE
jgi:putative transposase